jgi:hypothetical protein
MTDQIKRRTDGSIDTCFYTQRGRRMRAEAARGMTGSAASRSRSARAPGMVWVVLAMLVLGISAPFVT